MRILLVAASLVVALAPAAHADFDQAMGYLKSAKYLEAAAEFQTIVDENPEYADGHNLLGVCFLKSKKPADAEKSFLKAIEINPDSFNYQFNLANAYLMQQDYGKVVGALNTAESKATAEEKKRIYRMRGSALAVQKKWAESIDDLELAVRAGPDARTLSYLGKAYFKVGDNAKAVSTLQQVLKTDPSNAASQQLLTEGLLNLAAKTNDEAVKKKHYADAQASARSYLKLKPGSDAEYLVGRAALGAGDYPAAVASFTKVTEAKPGHCNAKANLGKAHIATKSWDKAIGSLVDATKCNAKMAVAWEGMGFAYQKKASATRDEGKTDEAKLTYDQAIDAYKKGLAIKPSSASEAAIDVCMENKKRIDENIAMDEEEAANRAAIEAEKKRIEEEKAKREKWKEDTEDD